MPQHLGYWVDLAGVKFDEHNDGSASSWIQAMPHGTYEHPVYGKIEFTEERSKRFADNVAANVRGQELDIDYDHKERTGEAAGWVKAAEAKPDGLYLLVEWTKEAASKIKQKAYRYFSPEFVDEWKHPQSGKEFKDVLFGGGITNRPFLKGILPINLSELQFGEEVTQGGQMDPKKLRALLGLPEDSTDEQVMTQLTERLSAGGTQQSQQTNQLSEETKSELMKLAESNPAVKALAEKLEEQGKELAETTAALRLAEIDRGVKALAEKAAAKKFAFPAPVMEELPKLLAELPRDAARKVSDLLIKLAEAGIVSLGELGGKEHENETDAVKVFGEKVQELMKTDSSLSYRDAVARVADANPQLFDEYRDASTAFRV